MTGTEKPAVAQPRTVNERGDDPDARPMLYDPLQGSKTTKSQQYLATVIICLGAAAAGTGLAWTSPVLDQLKSFNSPIVITKDEGTWIASFLAIGAIIGAVPSGILADKLGRKKTAIIIAVPYIISYLLIVFAQNVMWLYAARLLIGIAIGGSCVVCPVYISEYAETSIRGMLGTCFQLFLTVGILFVFVIGAYTSWITLSWTCLAMPVLNLVGLFFLPESPIWLLKNHRETEAATAIKWFWGRHCNANGAIQAIKNELEAAGSGSGSIRDLFAVTANRRGFFICVSLMFFQQFSGINAVIFFSVGIFKAAGSNLDPNVCAIIVGVVQVLMTFAAAVLVERAGRKVLLLLSSMVMALCLFVLGVYFYLKDHNHDVSNIGIIPLLSLVLFIICFSLGYGPIPWMMMGEMLAVDIKGIATSFTVEFNWISVFIITKSFEPMIEGFGGAVTFWIFGAIMVVGTVYGYICLFETKGKSNTEIQIILAGDK
ncbi:facilitated trehalose transporter Tret1-like isoform X2 [Sitodiplosis mosellana]|uniref:facilitated trehalose transporter Tret1-like isoform X2 n=1 Tax=Sitodiplosis mosellana TaxID=263140 RepID=UPI0024448AB9|nr:facilitated trehalose transporter Tret1-like isoform X2 [Sitodiplosis mosellana]